MDARLHMRTSRLNSCSGRCGNCCVRNARVFARVYLPLAFLSALGSTVVSGFPPSRVAAGSRSDRPPRCSLPRERKGLAIDLTREIYIYVSSFRFFFKTLLSVLTTGSVKLTGFLQLYNVPNEINMQCCCGSFTASTKAHGHPCMSETGRLKANCW